MQVLGKDVFKMYRFNRDSPKILMSSLIFELELISLFPLIEGGHWLGNVHLISAGGGWVEIAISSEMFRRPPFLSAKFT